MIGGYQFTYSGVAQSDIIAKGQVWTLSGDANNKLTRADSGSTFSFLEPAGFSGGGWVEVVNTVAIQPVFSKWGNISNREWRLIINGDETMTLALNDVSQAAQCLRGTSATLSVAWHHVYFNYDGTGTQNGITLYIDGVAVSMAAGSCVDYIAMEDTGQEVAIGYEGQVSAYFQGDMGHLELNATTVTADQVLKKYNSTKMFYGL